jgi:hypothetical protein
VTSGLVKFTYFPFANSNSPLFKFGTVFASILLNM